IDTAGRFIDQFSQASGVMDDYSQENREDWENLLHLLLKHRSRSPINGVIFCIRVPDILDPDPARVEQTAEMLRNALRDIEEKLKIQCPVYIMVTMCDRLDGFFDFFSLLPGLADRSLCGWSKEYLVRGTDGLKENLSRLSDRFRKLRLGFMHEKAALADNDPSQAQGLNRLYAFPDEFDTLLPPLERILEEAFKPSTFHEGLFLRGVYFTSSLQKGEAPVIGACSNLLGGFSLNDPGTGTVSTDAGHEWAEKANSKAFFIADFFEEKVFREKGCVKLTEKVREKRRRNDIIALVSGTFVAVVIMLWAAIKGWDLNSDAKNVNESLLKVQQSITPGHNDYLYPKAADTRDPGAAKTLSTQLTQLWNHMIALDENAAWFHQPVVEERFNQGRVTVVHTFAHRVFLPAVLEYLEKGNRPAKWHDAQRVYHALSMMYYMAMGPAHCDGSVLIPELFAELDSRGFFSNDTLARQLPVDLSAIESEEEKTACGECFAVALRSPDSLDLLLNRMREWVLTPLKEGLDQLDNSPENLDGFFAESSVESGLNTGMDRGWTLDWICSLDQHFSNVLNRPNGLKKILLLMDVTTMNNWIFEENFRSHVLDPWKTQYQQVKGTYEVAQQVVGAGLRSGIENPQADLGKRKDWIKGVLDMLSEARSAGMIGRQSEAAFKGLERETDFLSKSIEDRNEEVLRWLQPGQQGVTREHLLLTVTEKKADSRRQGDPGQSSDTVLFLQTEDLGAWKADLETLNNLITHDIKNDDILNTRWENWLQWPDRKSQWLERRLNWFNGALEGKEGPDSKPASKIRFLNPEEVENVRNGFREWLLVSFYRETARASASEKADLIVRLDDKMRTEFESSVTSRQKAPYLWPKNGFAFSAKALKIFLSWSKQISSDLRQKKENASPGTTALWDDFLREHAGLNDYYEDQFKRFWSAGVASSLTDYLARETMDLVESPFERLHARVAWPSGKSQGECLKNVGDLLKIVGCQYDEVQGENYKDTVYRTGFSLWKRYHDQKNREGYQSAAESLLNGAKSLLDVFEKMSEKEGSEREYKDHLDLLKTSIEKERQLSAFRTLDQEWGKSEIADPILSAFRYYEATLLKELGTGAESLFKKLWPDVRQASKAVQGYFPFTGTDLLEDVSPKKVKLADWAKTQAFLSSDTLSSLCDTIGEDLFLMSPVLFDVNFANDQVRTCFKRCFELRNFFLQEPKGTFRVERIRNWNNPDSIVTPDLWAFLPNQERGSAESIFSTNTFTPFDVPIVFDGTEHRIVLQSRDFTNNPWVSYHPLPPNQQRSPWNFFVWLWLWGEYDDTDNGFWVKVQFPENKVLSSEASLGEWQSAISRNAVKGMDMLIIPPAVFPKKPPDLRSIGWD
ncbi:MAG: type VI secretion system protein, partial [Planctomycetota bacterium]